MTKILASGVWLLDLDTDLMDRSGVDLQDDYLASDFSTSDLWTVGNLFPSKDKKLVYKMRGNRLERLDSYDFYPATKSVPVITDRMKNAILQLCGSGQVAFQPCEIRTKKGDVRSAWNLCPLNCIWCVDREQTMAKWSIPDLVPEEVSINYTDHLVLKPDCLASLHIARMREGKSNLIVSDELKQVMEAVNPKGIKFVSPQDAVLGFKPSDWDAIRRKH